jgi:hypothetical protein
MALGERQRTGVDGVRRKLLNYFGFVDTLYVSAHEFDGLSSTKSNINSLSQRQTWCVPSDRSFQWWQGNGFASDPASMGGRRSRPLLPKRKVFERGAAVDGFAQDAATNVSQNLFLIPASQKVEIAFKNQHATIATTVAASPWRGERPTPPSSLEPATRRQRRPHEPGAAGVETSRQPGGVGASDDETPPPSRSPRRRR